MASSSKPTRWPSVRLEATMNFNSSTECPLDWVSPLTPRRAEMALAERSIVVTSGPAMREKTSRIGATSTASLSAEARATFFGTTSPRTT